MLRPPPLNLPHITILGHPIESSPLLFLNMTPPIIPHYSLDLISLSYIKSYNYFTKGHGPTNNSPLKCPLYLVPSPEEQSQGNKGVCVYIHSLWSLISKLMVSCDRNILIKLNARKTFSYLNMGINWILGNSMWQPWGFGFSTW